MARYKSKAPQSKTGEINVYEAFLIYNLSFQFNAFDLQIVTSLSLISLVLKVQ